MPFGVDEAGKGPVFGSMFAAAVGVSDESVLPPAIDDSKRLAPARREAIAADLRADDRVRIGVAEVSTDRIDDPATDMNALTVDAHARALGTAVAGFESGGGGFEEGADPGGSTGRGADPPSALCDACDTDADRFARRVGAACEATVDVDARHGADGASALVGAASVIAKVERDAHIAAIADEYGDVGSGYPGDPTTRAFLASYVEDYGDFPPFARESWSTCEDVLAAASQASLEEF